MLRCTLLVLLLAAIPSTGLWIHDDKSPDLPTRNLPTRKGSGSRQGTGSGIGDDRGGNDEDDEEDDDDDEDDEESPVYNLIFQVPLPIPPVKEPALYVRSQIALILHTLTRRRKIPSPVTGEDIWYYEKEIKPFN